jgi:competence protein ComEC
MLYLKWNYFEYQGGISMKRSLKLFTLIAFGVSSLIYPINSSEAATKPKPITVHYINVDQGDSTYIKTPNGDDILIDAGNKGKGDEVVAYLKKQKVDDIEVIISTHPDADLTLED